jgi:hypothetical protein
MGCSLRFSAVGPDLHTTRSQRGPWTLVFVRVRIKHPAQASPNRPEKTRLFARSRYTDSGSSLCVRNRLTQSYRPCNPRRRREVFREACGASLAPLERADLGEHPQDFPVLPLVFLPEVLPHTLSCRGSGLLPLLSSLVQAHPPPGLNSSVSLHRRMRRLQPELEGILGRDILTLGAPAFLNYKFFRHAKQPSSNRKNHSFGGCARPSTQSKLPS